MRFFVTFILITFAACGCVNNRQEMKLPLGDGDYLFVHKFAEAEQHRIKSITLNVIIKGMHVTVINNDRDDVFPKRNIRRRDTDLALRIRAMEHWSKSFRRKSPGYWWLQ